MYLGFTEEKQKLIVVFVEEEVLLDLPFSPPGIVDGWKIQPLTFPQVTFWLFVTTFILCYKINFQISIVDIMKFRPGRSVPACYI